MKRAKVELVIVERWKASIEMQLKGKEKASEENLGGRFTFKVFLDYQLVIFFREFNTVFISFCLRLLYSR